MSPEALEDLGRQIAEAISNKDLSALQAACDPEVEYTSRFTAVEGKTYRGLPDWSDYLADLTEAWDGFRITVEGFLPAPPDTLVAAIRVKGLARGSRAPVDERAYAVWEFRGNRAVRGRTYQRRAEALEAVGLRE